MTHRITWLGLAFTLTLAGCGAAGAAPPPESHLASLQPGGRVTLAAHDQTGPVTPVNGGDEVVADGCRIDIEGERIGARVRTFLTTDGLRTCNVFRYWDLHVPAQAEFGAQTFDTVLQAQISGTVSLRGFLFVCGYGHAGVAVDVTLFDLGPDGNDTPRAVHCEHVLAHALDPDLGLQGGVELTLAGGAPYVGVEGGFQVGFNLPLLVRRIRDDAAFGFQALVQRGHSYRVRVDLHTSARVIGSDALPALSFFMGGRADPDNQGSSTAQTTDSDDAELGDFLDPEYWIDGVHGMLDARLPNIKSRVLNAFGATPDFHFPEITVNLFGVKTTYGDHAVNLRDFPKSFRPSLADTAAALDAVDDLTVPRSLDEMIRTRLTTRDGTDSSRETRIDRPGLEVTDLRMTVATDFAEVLTRDDD